jgi:hypothetical protein
MGAIVPHLVGAQHGGAALVLAEGGIEIHGAGDAVFPALFRGALDPLAIGVGHHLVGDIISRQSQSMR